MSRPVVSKKENEAIVFYTEYLFLDYDRVLGNPNAAMERFYNAGIKAHVDDKILDEIKESRIKTEEEGESFDPLGILSKKVNDDVKDRLVLEFLKPQEGQLLYPDGVLLLQRLRKNNFPHGILTYYVNKEWQGLKLKASGIGNYIMVDDKKKGRYISSLQISPDAIKIDVNARIRAKYACLVDNNEVAFIDMPDNCRGLLLQRENGRLKSQKGNLPSGVSVIRSLNDVLIIGDRIGLR